jgi:lysine-N-methylase
MQNSRIRPSYAAGFQCIGSMCEDTCCQGWTVPIDKATWQKYRSLPPSPLRTLIDASVVVNERAAEDAAPNPATFARFQMNEQHQCPLLTEKKLCGIQTAMGEGMLSHACATYPRIVHQNDNQADVALALSCPEAARVVLLTRELLQVEPVGRVAEVQHSDAGAEMGSDLKQESLPAHFWAIRATVFKVVQNRTYPLWQRLFLLDLMCRRLDSIASRELDSTVPQYLVALEASLAMGDLRAAMDTLPSDNAAQMDVVLRLAGLMLHKSNVRPRFVECVQAFTAGIGNGPGATLDSLCAQTVLAHDRNFAPFFNLNPHILENFLINTIFRCQFPYGKQAIREGKRPEMVREFAQLAAQFVLMRGLLIGVAGFHGAKFSAEHVVLTVQAASKHFEHHPEFLPMALKLLKESELDGARGMAILLRNPKTDRSSIATMPTIPAISFPNWQVGRSASATEAPSFPVRSQ